ncbi:MAG: hypothetical protein HYY84_03080 [Deltaproteobacteria bacterium]|nr:hypothetical protein [Deltaproteobacteria bacterium]
MITRPFCAAVLGTLVAFSCASGPRSREAAAWLRDAVRAHRAADEALARRDREAAYATLVGLVGTAERFATERGDKRAVLMDAYFRLAEMALAAKNAPAALLWSSRGLKLGAANDVFSANLLIAKGHAAVALGDDALASESFHRALVINDALLAVALAEPAQ